MYFNIVVLSLVLVLPFLVSRQNRQPPDLFLIAALAWSCYGTWICLRHGLVSSHGSGTVRITLHHWLLHFAIFRYFIGAFTLLKILEFLRIAPNRQVISIAFWGFTSSVFFLAALQELFAGHEYPPIWSSSLTPDQIGLYAQAVTTANIVYTLSMVLFVATVLICVAKHSPTAARRAVRYIRSL